MTQADDHIPPLLDKAVLDRLRAELNNDDGIWTVFIENFIAQLPSRTERLRHTLTTGDLDGAMDAILSLRTSSQMVGAERLAGLALRLEQSLHQAREDEPAVILPRLAQVYLRQIKSCAGQTVYHLLAHVRGQANGGR